VYKLVNLADANEELELEKAETLLEAALNALQKLGYHLVWERERGEDEDR